MPFSLRVKARFAIPPSVSSTAPRGTAGINWLAAGFLAGLLAGWRFTGLPIWLWTFAALAFLGAAVGTAKSASLRVSLGVCGGDSWELSGDAPMNTRLRPQTLVLLLLGGALFCTGAARMTLAERFAAPGDLRALIGREPRLICLEGILEQRPRPRRALLGSTAPFDRRPPAFLFPVKVVAQIDRAGTGRCAAGRVLVKVDEQLPPLDAGDRVQVTGTLLPPSAPQNPGGFDGRRLRGRAAKRACWSRTTGPSCESRRRRRMISPLGSVAGARSSARPPGPV